MKDEGGAMVYRHGFCEPWLLDRGVYGVIQMVVEDTEGITQPKIDGRWLNGVRIEGFNRQPLLLDGLEEIIV